MLEIPYDEPRNLNTDVHDLVALTALSAVWHGHTPTEIADSLANALLTFGDLAFVYVRMTGLPDQDVLEIAHAHPRLSVTLQAPALGRILAPWLTFNGSTPPPSLPSPVGGGSLRIAVTPIGLEGTHGVVVAGAPQRAFPTKLDRLLLNVAVNQAAVALQAAQLVAALHETAELKDRLFAQERMARAEAEATVPRNAQFYFHDVTERTQAEQALGASEERFRRYFELGLIGMAITSPTKGILDGNDEICRILGYDRQELLQLTWAERSHPDDLAADIAQFNRVMAGEIDGYTLDKRWIRKDGQIIDTTIAVKCVRRVDGAVDHFVALLQDITERKRAELLQRQLAAIVESSDDAIISKDLEGVVLSWNVGAERLYGYTAAEIIGRSIALLFPPERQQEPRQILEQLKRGEHIKHYETERVRKDGARLYVSLTISPLYDAAGRIIAASTITRDISERKRAEAELVALKDRLATDLEAMTHLHALGERLLTTTALQPLLQEALTTSLAFLGADFGHIQLYNPQNGALKIVVQQGFDPAFLGHFSSVDDQHVACGRALQQATRVVTEDVETDEGFTPHRASAAATGFRAVQSTPLLDRDGHLLGMFSTHFRCPHQFVEHELWLTGLYARQIAEMIGFKGAQAQLWLAHETLEAKVTERTRELADTNATLQVEVGERKHAETEMHKFASLVENSTDFIGIAAFSGRALFVNAAGRALVGLTGDAAVQTTTMLDYVAEQDRKRFQQAVLPVVFRDGHWEGETLFRHFKTGALIPVWQHIFFLTEQDSQQRLALATISRDITERKHAEQARQHVLNQLIHAQEDERRRIAHDLHDSLGQYIIALDLGLKSIQARDGCPAPVKTSIQALRELALRLDGEIERLTFELRPSVLDDLGLKDAMRQHVQQWSVSSGIAVDFHTRGLNDKRLVDAVETTLYRIIQEALTNVRKHAAATRVSLIVERRRDEVLAIIEDDGSGFDLEAVQRTPRRFGLQSMTERAALAGGRLDLETAPGAGTTIYVHIPLDPEQR